MIPVGSGRGTYIKSLANIFRLWMPLVIVDEARVRIERWRSHYNTVRPHSALGNLAPEEFAASSGQASLAG